MHINRCFVSVLFICLSMAKIKRKPLISINDDRLPPQVQQNHVEVHAISNGIINVSFDDIDDIDMIDNSSIETFNEDQYGMFEIPVDLVIEDRKIGRSVSFKDDFAHLRSEIATVVNHEMGPKEEGEAIKNDNEKNPGIIKDTCHENSIKSQCSIQVDQNQKQPLKEPEKIGTLGKQDSDPDHVHGPSLFQCSKNCFQQH